MSFAPLGCDSITIRLAYNGDYPGCPCAWVNGRPVCDRKEEAFFLRMFGEENLKALFDKLGAKRIGDGAEHESIEILLEVKRPLTASPNQ